MWLSLTEMWRVANSDGCTEAEFETPAARFRSLARAFRQVAMKVRDKDRKFSWRQTVWVHAWTTHMGYFIGKYTPLCGGIFPFFQYGLEKRHRKDYKTLEHSTHGTTNFRSGLNGWSEAVRSDHLDAELVLRGFPRHM